MARTHVGERFLTHPLGTRNGALPNCLQNPCPGNFRSSSDPSTPPKNARPTQGPHISSPPNQRLLHGSAESRHKIQDMDNGHYILLLPSNSNINTHTPKIFTKTRKSLPFSLRKPETKQENAPTPGPLWSSVLAYKPAIDKTTKPIPDPLFPNLGNPYLPSLL